MAVDDSLVDFEMRFLHPIERMRERELGERDTNLMVVMVIHQVISPRRLI